MVLPFENILRVMGQVTKHFYHKKTFLRILILLLFAAVKLPTLPVRILPAKRFCEKKHKAKQKLK